jgi:uncharacterized protein YciI
MHYIVLGYDGTDEKALERRLAARDAHLEQAETLFQNGLWLYAAAILDDQGKMSGSMIVCDFPSREQIQTQWLDKEPYVLGNVWQTIKIHRAQVAPFCLPK